MNDREELFQAYPDLREQYDAINQGPEPDMIFSEIEANPQIYGHHRHHHRGHHVQSPPKPKPHSRKGGDASSIFAGQY